MFVAAWLLMAATAAGTAVASEYPERECCDPVNSPPGPMSATPNYAVAAAAAGYGAAVTSPPTITAVEGHREEKSSTGSLNCLMARSICNEDPSCFKIINLIPSLCGNEIVSCSTNTVIKCRAALKTLQAFPFFKPTCLCREPNIDYECNSFRNFLFDHPCNFTQRKEYDPFHIDTLASCNHASTVCESSPDCRRIFEDFKINCKVTKDNTCETSRPEDCHKYWLRLRKTPLFGCICPHNQVKKRCDRIFALINDNPCISSKSSPIDNSILNFQSTCHEALETCNKHPNCQEMVASIIRNCNQRNCRKTKCMESLQSFYRNESMHSFAIEIAFCLCKKSGVNKDKCLTAQEMLHPECAQRVDGSATNMPCHQLAETCRLQSDCRSRLETFEQTCSVDQMTTRCTGSPSACRESILGILGTMLRTNCACKDTSLSKFYDCMGWQRVFWFNSCVVEAQRDFHMAKIRNSVKLASRHSHTTATAVLEHEQTTAVAVKPLSPVMPWTKATDAPTTTTVKVLIAGQIFRSGTTAVAAPKPTTVTSTTTTATTAIAIDIATAITTVAATSASATTPMTTNIMLPSQVPFRGCSLQRSPHYNKQFMLEGEVIRLHSLEDSSCSEVCHCKTGESLTCQTICVEAEPCETEIAYYHHESPAYIAFRGRCVCYVGRFICMRPKMGSYALVPGVFLFVGYSEKDESLLKSLDIMNFEIKDLVYEIQKFIHEHMMFNTTCKLQLHSMSFENMIIMGKATQKLTAGGYLKNDATDIRSSVLQDNMACFDILKNFSYLVTTQAMQVKTNMILSVLKIAEVDILLPASNSWSTSISPNAGMLALTLVTITVLF